MVAVGRSAVRAVGMLFFLFSAGAASAEPVRVDEASAVAAAARFDAAARSLSIDLAAKERRAATAANIFLPSLTASVGATEGVGFPNDPDDEISLATRASAQLKASLSLSAASLQGMKTADFDASVARLQYYHAIEKVEKETRKTFYRLLLLREQVEAAKVAVEITQGSRDRTAEEYRFGLASERTKRQAEIAYENEKLALSRRTVEFDTARSSFASRIGLAADAELEIIGELPNVVMPDGKVEPTPSADISGRTDLAISSAQIALQQSKLEEERRDRSIPSISVSLSMSSDSKSLFVPNIYPLDTFENGASLSLTLSSPNLSAFLPFSKETVAMEASGGSLEKLRLQAAETARLARLEAEALIRAISVSASAIASLEQSFALAEEVLELTRDAYSVGAASYQDLRTAEKDLDAARVASLSERYTYLSALIDLEYATGNAPRSAKETP